MVIPSRCGWSYSTTSICINGAHSLCVPVAVGINQRGGPIARLLFLECADSSPLLVCSSLLRGKSKPEMKSAVKPAHSPLRAAALGDPFDSLHAFLQPLHRRSVRDANETGSAKAPAIGHHGLLFFEQFVCEVLRCLDVSFQTSAHIRKRIK